MEETTGKKKRGRPPLTPEQRASGVKQPYNKPSLANFGQEYVEPGDNSKYLTHALKTMAMPKIDNSDPKQVEERIYWYFNHCISNEMKPTVSGLCNALGITRETLRTWKDGAYRTPAHQAAVKQAYGVLEELWEDYMMNGKINPVSGIFIGKNHFGYRDQQDLVVTPNTGEIERVDPAIIEAKYAELPED